ncbi:IS110 family transposase [Roseibium sp.]|uniref:IS110 family transposase n=1 Tax=Roseibium sp. TaxID=1936156 RepID=UPI003A984AA0
MTLHPDVIGCDVSKAHLDLFDTGTCIRISNTVTEITRWLGQLNGRTPFFVLEATGRYDRVLVKALEVHGIGYARVNPARARAFAKATGHLAKTDCIDARMLARLGQSLAPKAALPRDPDRVRLEAVHRRRAQLVAVRQKDKQRLCEATADERDSLRRHITWLDREIARLEEKVRALLHNSAVLARQEKLLRSVPGIGPVTAVTLMTLLPELGTLSAKSLASLAGLTPFNADSGRFCGKRSIRGGRKPVRDALYMAAVTASRSNSRFKAFANTLGNRGKPFKVKTIAVARKLLTTANAVIRDEVPFTQ